MLARQEELRFLRHGGRRKGAGRPRGSHVSHAVRPRFERVTPVHVTLRVKEHVWNLRSGRSFRRIEGCFEKARGRFGLRLIHFSVQGNHLHLIVEADGTEALTRGIQGLAIRIARALNAIMRRAGRVFGDHYHARLLRSPTELVNAIRYVLGNARHHFGRQHGAAGGTESDRYASNALAPGRRSEVLADPRGWLLREGIHRARAQTGASAAERD